MAQKISTRQLRQHTVLPMAGNTADESLDSVLSKIDAQIAKHFEDRNVLLTDGGLITYTGTQLQFTEALNIVLNQKISGAAPQIIALGSTTLTLSASGRMIYAVIDRTAGTATVTDDATTLPAAAAANQEVFLIAKRVDAADGTQRVYWRNGMGQNAGQSLRLGAAGSGSGGSGTGDDLTALQYRASFRDGFDEGPTDTKSGVDSSAGFTDANTYSAAKALYQLNFDASKTVAAGTTTTNFNLSAVASFTVKIGDVAIANGQARKITAVASQQSFTTEAFSVAPTLGAQATVSQAVYTKDIYNLPVDGNALAAAFSGATFQEVLIDLEDTSTVGDAIFDVNVAPVIGYSASQNGTSFTDVKTRPTLETDTMQSVMLPAAGTGLYLRFFALKTSGSGSVNLLGYRAFMQKSVVATAGGITNSAYGFTNGVGTPINTTVGVAGGKTTLTLGWQYAVGVLPGTTASSIEVWLNGQKLPRFVNSTITPDGSFQETSSSVITLDKDYSSLNLSIEVFQRTQIVDNSTTNTTNIAYQQEVQAIAFQSFVNSQNMMSASSAVGSPAAGLFYSAIQNRAQMIDLTNDLRPRMGIIRTPISQIFRVPTEFGVNGESVFGLSGDVFGGVRFVGVWGYQATAAGPIVGSSSALTDYVEVTFFGTGLSLLTNVNTTAFDVRASVDGGAEGANIMPNASPVLNGRNYNSNTVVPAVTGLTLGVHTVKLRNNSAGTFNVHGFETYTDVTTLRVSPGTSYASGNKMTLGSAVNVPHNSGFETGTLGARGGRVLTYHKADGTIGRAVTPAGSQQNMTLADHSNEEVARIYHFAEFSASRSDDFTNYASGTLVRQFTTDDNSSTLLLSGVNTQVIANGVGIDGSGGQGRMSFTFVGTGLDVEMGVNSGVISTNVIQVDGGASIGTFGTAAITTPYRKVVSGLPYGTHTVTFLANSAGASYINFKRFIVYQPKTPTLPSGATDLGAYNVPATYVAGTTNDVDTVSTGVIRKTFAREMTLVGTWSVQINALAIGSFDAFTSTNGDYAEYTFFGTGVDFRFGTTSAAGSMTMSIDGSTNLSAFTTSFGGGGTSSFTASTGVITTNTLSTNGNRASVSGLALGFHKVRVTKTTGTQFFFNSFDIITPVHSYKEVNTTGYQNVRNVGSQGIEDRRKWTPVKGTTQKNASQAVGLIASPTTSSTSYVPIPDMKVLHTNTTSRVKVTYFLRAMNSSAGVGTGFQVFMDGVAIGNAKVLTQTTDNTVGDSFVVDVSPGTPHIFEVQWFNGSGAATSTANGTSRNLTVEEA